MKTGPTRSTSSRRPASGRLRATSSMTSTPHPGTAVAEAVAATDLRADHPIGAVERHLAGQPTADPGQRGGEQDRGHDGAGHERERVVAVLVDRTDAQQPQ